MDKLPKTEQIIPIPNCKTPAKSEVLLAKEERIIDLRLEVVNIKSELIELKEDNNKLRQENIQLKQQLKNFKSDRNIKTPPDTPKPMRLGQIHRPS